MKEFMISWRFSRIWADSEHGECARKKALGWCRSSDGVFWLKGRQRGG